MQQTAIGWLVYRLTDSVLYLGVIGFAAQIPTFFLAPFAGVLADKVSKHKIVIGTQVLLMLQALMLAALMFAHKVEIGYLIALSVFLGVINAFDMTTRQAFVYELLEKQDDLPNAIALNSMVFNGARLIGPPLAGVLIAAAGEGICFFLNGVSYIAVIAALMVMKIKAREVPQQNGPVLRGLKEGLVYAYNFLPIRGILLLLTFVSLIGMSYAVLMPVFARDILHGGPQTLGLLIGAGACGALIGAVFLASRDSILGLGRVLLDCDIYFRDRDYRVFVFDCAVAFAVADGNGWVRNDGGNRLNQYNSPDDSR